MPSGRSSGGSGATGTRRTRSAAPSTPRTRSSRAASRATPSSPACSSSTRRSRRCPSGTCSAKPGTARRGARSPTSATGSSRGRRRASPGSLSSAEREHGGARGGGVALTGADHKPVPHVVIVAGGERTRLQVRQSSISWGKQGLPSKQASTYNCPSTSGRGVESRIRSGMRTQHTGTGVEGIARVGRLAFSRACLACLRSASTPRGAIFFVFPR
mmetsp:Transcript_15174/g.50369  ORF Transcript_15174/g.50369 Transcript_15174/m.50369 type:complete len:215 (+) Transcript_15174:579-1223(+)